MNGNPGLALSNAYGSNITNITNITLILGVTALIAPMTGRINRPEGGTLLVVYLAYTGWLVYTVIA